MTGVATMAWAGGGVATAPAHAQGYTTYRTWGELTAGKDAQYLPLVRISDPGTSESPAYTGFWFFGILQFDSTGRYMLGMKVHFQNRDVQPADRGDIGFIDLRNGNRWTKIGETTAWNWQQGCRLQWRPGSDEILWNDRSDDGKSFVCRVHDFGTGARRTLPRPIYDLSPDGSVALTHDFQRMKHAGTDYVGIPDPFRGQAAPSETGIWKMDLNTGNARLILSLARIAKICNYTSPTDLYVFRTGWNPSGTRFITFLKGDIDQAWSMDANGQDARFFYGRPSHHTWQDDTQVFDGRFFSVFADNGSGAGTQLAQVTGNPDPTYLPGIGGDWILGDTYPLNSFQHLFLFHRPTKLFVPLAKLKDTAKGGVHRIDLHARASRDGRVVSIDASHEGLGRQMYIVHIGHILDNPPGGGGPGAAGTPAAPAVDPVEAPLPEGVRVETVADKTTPQGELSMQVYYPPGWKAEDKRPAIVFFFGGGWTGGTMRQFDPQAKYLAGRGMVAACADYRVASRHKTTPFECVEDAKSAVRYVRASAAKMGVDPDRIAAGGGSAGGHIAACTATVEGLDAAGEDAKVSSRPNLLVLYNPVLNLTGARVAGRFSDAEKARLISPNHHLTKAVPPAILYYGSQDQFLEHGKEYLAKARELGLAAEVHVAEGAGHGFFNRPPWLDPTTCLTDRFLARHGYLTGEPTLKLPEGTVSLQRLAAEAGKQ